jgi:hypothetical protein
MITSGRDGSGRDGTDQCRVVSGCGGTGISVSGCVETGRDGSDQCRVVSGRVRSVSGQYYVSVSGRVSMLESNW